MMWRLLLALVLSLSLGTALQAKDLKLPVKDPYVSLSFPWNWKITKQENSAKVVSSDKHVNLSFEALDTKTTDVQAAMAKQVQELVAAGLVIDPETAKQEEAKIAGCDMIEASWDATHKEVGPMKVSVSILHLPDHKALCILFWASKAGEERNKATLARMLMSVKLLPSKNGG